MLEIKFALLIACISTAAAELTPLSDFRKPFSCATCLAFWLSLLYSAIHTTFFPYIGLCMILAALIRKLLNWPNLY